MSFRPNDKVVRVGGKPEGRRRHPQGCPHFGRVYVVEECWQAHTGIWLLMPVGFTPMYNDIGQRMGWPADAFRLVSEVGHPAVSIEQCEEART
jgi:hypothetical protein